jgi:hypothetical protein
MFLLIETTCRHAWQRAQLRVNQAAEAVPVQGFPLPVKFAISTSKLVDLESLSYSVSSNPALYDPRRCPVSWLTRAR